jgi:hypothetical protein
MRLTCASLALRKFLTAHREPKISGPSEEVWLTAEMLAEGEESIAACDIDGLPPLSYGLTSMDDLPTEM